MTDSNWQLPSTLPASQPPIPPRRRRWPILAGLAFIAVLILGAGSFVVASALEDHDSFCIACHTVPETTYFNRAYISLDNSSEPVTDLATAHYHLAQQKNTAAFACINCHRGDASLTQRVSTIALGGRDAVIYVVGREDPTIEKTQTAESWLPNAACVSCHTDTLLRLQGLDNHFHNYLPQAAQALANGGTLTVPDSSLSAQRDQLLKRGLKTINTTLTCTDCHVAHGSVNSGEKTSFMDVARRNQECVTCHVAAKEGPQNPKQIQ